MHASSPLVRYRQLIESAQALPDPHQLEAVGALDELWHRLRHKSGPTLWQRLRKSRAPRVKGLYLWGGVGRGKTWLMDLFYESLPGIPKHRFHFHRFMHRIHGSLKTMDRVQNPLARLAAEWARGCRILCLDEFFVTDIADAMILSGLLENLFAQDVTLVTTSNLEPGALYRDGLQRARFLPAISLIERRTRVLHLRGSFDFRLRALEKSNIYHWPLGDRSGQLMAGNFERLAAGCELDRMLMINDRPFEAIRRASARA